MKLISINGEKGASEEVEELHFNQEEADTMIVLHIFHASKHSPDDATVTVRSPTLASLSCCMLYFCQKILQKVNKYFDIGNKDKHKLLDMKAIMADTGDDICMALSALHA